MTLFAHRTEGSGVLLPGDNSSIALTPRHATPRHPIGRSTKHHKTYSETIRMLLARESLICFLLSGG
ncbi:unnamed protein product [Onchocerca flexuosa]|uniref:Uncharacterized protein n=1 Tax=Onchocerca flexuosa TaxID=387005 RepID=A0A183I017_9BILA|nr:unnamed protein product [Onchocerca flexuosa]